MRMDLDELTERLARVSDLYARRTQVRRDDDWFLLKLQEELGELTAEHLRLTGRRRRKGMDEAAMGAARADEAADLLATLLLYARHNAIDLAAAVERKWLAHLEAPDACPSPR